MLRHHTMGVGDMVEQFGPDLVLSTGRVIPTRWVGEQHLMEDFGFQPTIKDWLETIKPEPWMVRGARKFGLSEEGQPKKSEVNV